MAIDFQTARKVVPFVCDVRKPVMFRGRHGIGKSEVVYQIADELGLKVVERRASQMTEGDLIGLPSTDGDVTSFNPPDWYQECCDEPRMLYLDEIDRATTEVRQGIFELTDSRKLNGRHLHEGTLVFASINGGKHGAQYQVGEMDPAELDRWTVFDLEPSVEDWLVWAKTNVDPITYDFIKMNPNHLEHKDEFEPNKVYPSRRSWKRCNDALVKANLLEEEADLGILFTLTTAFVGFEAGMQFQHYVNNYSRLLTPQNIVDDAMFEKAAKLDHAEHAAMVDKIAEAYFTKSDVSDEQIHNMVQYWGLLSPEVAMMFWKQLGVNVKAGNAKDIFVKFHNGVIGDGRTVKQVMYDMLTNAE